MRSSLVLGRQVCHWLVSATPSSGPRWAAARSASSSLRSRSSIAFPGYPPDALDSPLSTAHAAPPAPSTVAASSPALAEKAVEDEEDPNSSAARARQVFKPLRGDPAERKAFVSAQSTMIHGVLVPPRPEEPENCCMSGCAHCVWDEYREEMEEWMVKRKESERAGAVAAAAAGADHDGMPIAVGGGEEEAEADPFADIPVGIREFMKIEKKLKERQREARG